MRQPGLFFLWFDVSWEHIKNRVLNKNSMRWNMYMKTFVLIASTFILLLSIANAEINDYSPVKKIVSVTDTLKTNITVQEAVWSPDGSKLLVRCTSSKDPFKSVSELYVMNAEGTDFNKLVSTPVESVDEVGIASLTWSPSGDKIAFLVFNWGSGNCLAVSNPDGTGLNAIGTDITDMESIFDAITVDIMQTDLQWSPDSTKMAFLWRRESKDGTYIYMADEDGTNCTKLYQDSENRDPVWSHDSKKIAFETNNSLMCININGKNLTYLSNGTKGTKFGNKYIHYSWSPDNSKLLYMGATEEIDDKEQFSIFLTKADGLETTEIMRGPVSENTQWNPDGSKILFKKETNGNYELYTANAHGKNITLLHEGDIKSESWNPDGNKISFLDDYERSLYIINPDGTGKTLIASSLNRSVFSKSDIITYAWNPSDDKIAVFSSVNPFNKIFLSDSDGTISVPLIEAAERQYYEIDSWSPDGTRLLVTSITLSDKGEFDSRDLLVITPGSQDENLKNDNVINSSLKNTQTQRNISNQTTAAVPDETEVPDKEENNQTPGFTSLLSVIGLVASFYCLLKNTGKSI